MKELHRKWIARFQVFRVLKAEAAILFHGVAGTSSTA